MAKFETKIETMGVKELADRLVVSPGVTLLVLKDLREIEDIDDYLIKLGIKSRYLHEEVGSHFRVEILKAFERGDLEVLITTPKFAVCIPPRLNFSLS